MGNKLPIETERKLSHNSEYEALRESVLQRYKQMEQEFDRSHKKLYAFLGCIYETAAIIDGNPGLRSALVQDVDQMLNEGREGKRRWKASKHDTFDLLLTLRLKLNPDTAALKSGWLAALRAAHCLTDDNGNAKPVDSNETGFVNWITPIGVYGAKKLGQSKTSFDISDFVEGLGDPPPEGSFQIELPSDAEPVAGLIVIIGRVVNQDGRKADVEQVEVVTDKARVTSMASWTMHEWERHNKRMAREEQRERLKKFKRELEEPGETDFFPASTHRSGKALRDAVDREQKEPNPPRWIED